MGGRFDESLATVFVLEVSLLKDAVYCEIAGHGTLNEELLPVMSGRRYGVGVLIPTGTSAIT